MKSAGKARSNGLYRHIRTSKEIIRNLLNDSYNNSLMITLSFQQGIPISLRPPLCCFIRLNCYIIITFCYAFVYVIIEESFCQMNKL